MSGLEWHRFGMPFWRFVCGVLAPVLHALLFSSSFFLSSFGFIFFLLLIVNVHDNPSFAFGSKKKNHAENNLGLLIYVMHLKNLCFIIAFYGLSALIIHPYLSI